MGRKSGELHINAKKFGGLAKPCMKDMITFLGCLSLNHNNDEKCARQRQSLDSCLEAQTGKKEKTMGDPELSLAEAQQRTEVVLVI